MRPAASRGYALVIALILVASVGFATLVAATHYDVELQREREAQLLFVGDQYRRALQSYAGVAPVGGLTQYPAKLDDLLEDKRFPKPMRHLRRLYVDPMTGAADWQLELSQGRIIGLHSRSARAPLRHANFPDAYAAFTSAKNYGDWHFAAVAASTALVPGATSPLAGPQSGPLRAAPGSAAPAAPSPAGTGLPGGALAAPPGTELATPPSPPVPPPPMPPTTDRGDGTGAD